ncbi:MAG: leucine-rich repeat domain-containing protein [Richelia sp. CSU_2_1]|nr:leucine-rich repeat domain-containing protein [Richelia sp. CSU_2_1]
MTENLTKLYLSFNQISDIKSLASLTNLTKLYLSYNQISDIKPLASLTNLTELDLRNNRINQGDIAWLREKLPRCQMFFS